MGTDADGRLRSRVEQARQHYVQMRTDVAALMVMEPELRDLARAVARIEVGMEKQNLRLDEIEDTLASVRGMATLAKFVTSILGIGGIALIVTAISRGSV